MPALTVPTIFTAVDKLSSVISKMQGNVGKFATDTQKKYAAMSRSAQAWSTNSRQVALSAGIMGAAIIAPLALSVKKAMEFEDQMANVGTIIDTTKESLTGMGNQVLSIFTKVPVKLDDLTEALYKIRSAGIPAAQAMNVLNSAAKLGVAGRGTTVEATQMLTGAIKVFASEGLNANQIAGLLFETVRKGNTKISDMSEAFGATAPIIAAGGVKLKDFSAMVSAMTSVSTPAAQVMNEIRASVIAMEKPSTRMAFLFHNLGIKNLQEGITKFGNLGGVMQAVEDKAKSMGVNINKAIGKVNAMTAFTLLTSISKQDYQKNSSSMNTSDADFAAAYALKLQTLKAQSQLLSNELQYFAIKAGTVLIPILVKVAKFLQPVIEGFGHWIDNNPKLAKAIIFTAGAIGSLLVVIAPIALIISGIADAVKLWAGLNLLLAGNAAVATTAIASQTVVVGGFGSALSGVTGAAATANGAMETLIGTIAAFVIPAGLAGLAGYGIFKSFQSDAARDAQRTVANLDPYSKEGMEYVKWAARQPISKGLGDDTTDPQKFLNYWYNKSNSKNRVIGDSDYVAPALGKVQPALMPGSMPTTQQVEILLHDPHGVVKSVNSKPVAGNGAGIPIKVTSTTGNR